VVRKAEKVAAKIHRTFFCGPDGLLQEIAGRLLEIGRHR
jgi:hypothetical protein